jgi:putative transposase
MRPLSDRDPLYRGHGIAAEITAREVWLNFRFPFSLRLVEDLLAARGIMVYRQTGRLCPAFSHEIRRRSALMPESEIQQF